MLHDTSPRSWLSGRAPACGAAAATLLLLGACSSPTPKPELATAAVRPESEPAAGSAQSGTAAYGISDWHPLVVAPFGTLLKEFPIRLHEVLLFRDRSQAPAEAESGDCYAADEPAPAIAGRVPDLYLLCFEHDRLERIEAMARIPGDDAAGVFQRICAGWFGSAQQRAAMGDLCEGRDGDVAFRARLEPLPDEHAAEVHVTLSGAVGRDAELPLPPDSEAPSPAVP